MEFKVLFKAKDPGPVKTVEVQLEAEKPEAAAEDARNWLKLPVRLFPLEQVKAVEGPAPPAEKEEVK